MARRLAPAARRAEIIRRTREGIAAHGPDGLSLREVARWCGMSAPGILHYFDGLTPLLEEVLAQRDAEMVAGAIASLERLGEGATLRDFADAIVMAAVAGGRTTRMFDALEVRAIADPGHPAHDYYMRFRTQRLSPIVVGLAAREYDRPEEVSAVLGLVADGLRHRWLRSEDTPDFEGDWGRVRDTVFAGFEQFRKR